MGYVLLHSLISFTLPSKFEGKLHSVIHGPSVTLRSVLPLWLDCTSPFGCVTPGLLLYAQNNSSRELLARTAFLTN